MTDWLELTLMEKVELVRNTVSPLDIVEQDGIEVHAGKIRSPFNPDERTPSCHLYEDGWFDFSTGKGGDVLDLVMALHGITLSKAAEACGRLILNEDWDQGRVRQHQPAEPPDLTEQLADLHELTTWDLSQWWLPRLKPLTRDVFTRLARRKVLGGSADTLAVPHWHDGVVRGIKIRGDGGRKSAVPGSTFACGPYWPVPATGASSLVIAEGESDSWCLLQAQVPADVAALPSGAGVWKDKWLDQLEQYETIYTAFDNDRAGQQATEKVRNSIGWGRWKELKVPTLFNDVREAMAAGWEPKL